MTDRSKTWQEMVELVEHYRAIDWMDHHILDLKIEDIDTLPWQYVTEASSGGAYRWNVPTSINVTAVHPCGLTFKWWHDLEDGNRGGPLNVSVPLVRSILGHLPYEIATSVRSELWQHVKVLREHGEEQQQSADQLCAAADAIEAMARYGETA